MSATSKALGIKAHPLKVERRKSGQQLRPLRFLRVPHPHMAQPCIVVTSHAQNEAGYISLSPRRGPQGRKEPVHRLALASKYGPIPEGYEADHICGVRQCVNRKHLRLLSRSEHKRVTNATRYADKQEQVRCLWEAHGRIGSSALGRLANVPQVTAARWVRLWKAEEAAESYSPNAL